jgi:hypothetical protein
VRIEVPPDASPSMPAVGQEIRHLSSRFLDLPQPREASLPLYRIPLDLRVRLREAGRLEAESPGFPAFARHVAVEASTRHRAFLPILASLLEESGASLFRPGEVSFFNDCGLPDDGIFIRPAELKRLKNELYSHFDRAFMERLTARSTAPAAPGLPPGSSPLDSSDLARLSQRQLLSPPDQAPIPFAGGEPTRLTMEALADVAGFRWLPLPPVLMDDAGWIEAVGRLAQRHPGARIAVGLNNVSHLAVAEALESYDNVWFFADFFLYVANVVTLQFLSERVPRLLFAYRWVEGPRAERVVPPGLVPLVEISDEFQPPMFYSLACVTRNSTNAGRCEEDCPRDFSGELRQGRNRFRLIVRDCVTYLLRI